MHVSSTHLPGISIIPALICSMVMLFHISLRNALEAVLSSISLNQSAFSILNPLLCMLLQDEPYFFNRVEIRALIRMNDHRNPVSM
jgi:hypothetical protein